MPRLRPAAAGYERGCSFPKRRNARLRGGSLAFNTGTLPNACGPALPAGGSCVPESSSTDRDQALESLRSDERCCDDVSSSSRSASLRPERLPRFGFCWEPDWACRFESDWLLLPERPWFWLERCWLEPDDESLEPWPDCAWRLESSEFMERDD